MPAPTTRGLGDAGGWPVSILSPQCYRARGQEPGSGVRLRGLERTHTQLVCACGHMLVTGPQSSCHWSPVVLGGLSDQAHGKHKQQAWQSPFSWKELPPTCAPLVLGLEKPTLSSPS